MKESSAAETGTSYASVNRSEKIDYDNLEISEFVGGFLEFLNSQPESAQQRYLAYVKLLMERAATYSWNSVQNVHISINTVVEAGRLSLQQFDQIKDGAQTFFTHADLPSAPTTPRVSIMSFQAIPIAKSGITQATVTAHRRKQQSRAFTVAVFAMQITQCYNVQNVASQFLTLSPARLNQKTNTDYMMPLLWRMPSEPCMPLIFQVHEFPSRLSSV